MFQHSLNQSDIHAIFQHMGRHRVTEQMATTNRFDVGFIQIKRYEAGTAQPMLEGLIEVTQCLHVSLDELVFEENDRGSSEDKLKLLFEPLSVLIKQSRILSARYWKGC